ncbi:MAG: glycerophosphodiester phosphodiesterase family protein [Spirochaetota bacterium]
MPLKKIDQITVAKFLGTMEQKILILFLMVSSLLYCSSAKAIEPKPAKSFEIHGHRGARGLSPENTIPAFRTAWDLQVDFLELDTVVTADKEIVVYHDVYLNPKICRSKEGKKINPIPVGRVKLEDFKSLDCGGKNRNFPEQKAVPQTPPPTLAEVFAFVQEQEKQFPEKKKLQFNVEIKVDTNLQKQDYATHLRKVVALAKEYGFADRLVVQSFFHASLRLCKKEFPEIRTSALFSTNYWNALRLKFGLADSLQEEVILKAKKMQADYISPFYLYISPEFILKAHKLGLKVVPWTVNKPKEMQRFINMGVDGIISDYPDKLVKAWQSTSGK